MCKLFISSCIGVILVGNSFANTPVYGSATSFDQLTHRVLDSGQIAWMEDDGSAVMYVGSMTENKNIKVSDPSALRGCRVVEINSELIKSCSTNMTIESDGVFKFQLTKSIISTPDKYRYNLIKSELASGDVDYYAKEGDSYKIVDIAEGTNISGLELYTRESVWVCKLLIASKDSNIKELDYLYQERQGGGLNDFTSLKTSRSITYDGRYAYLDIEVSYGNSANTVDWFTVGNFTATTIGIGDQLDYVNDLSRIKFLIHDSLCSTNKDSRNYGFDLYKLRDWVTHLYDGNRGEDWSKYASKGDIKLGSNYINFESVYGNTTNKYSIGGSGGTFGLCSDGISFLDYRKYKGPGSIPQGMEIQITSWNVHATESPIMEFMSNNSINNTVSIKILHKPVLDKGIWRSINAVITPLDDSNTYFKAEIPSVYRESYKSGFFKVYYNPDKYKDVVKITATLSILGSDGKYYKLMIPEGGGTVTAVLDEDQN